MRRFGSVIRVRPESLEVYKECLAAVRPEVLAMIRRCNIRNNSIYLKKDLLFGYFEHRATNYAADTAKMEADPKTQERWAIMMPWPVSTLSARCQQRVEAFQGITQRAARSTGESCSTTMLSAFTG